MLFEKRRAREREKSSLSAYLPGSIIHTTVWWWWWYKGSSTVPPKQQQQLANDWHFYVHHNSSSRDWEREIVHVRGVATSQSVSGPPLLFKRRRRENPIEKLKSSDMGRYNNININSSSSSVRGQSIEYHFQNRQTEHNTNGLCLENSQWTPPKVTLTSRGGGSRTTFHTVHSYCCLDDG